MMFQPTTNTAADIITGGGIRLGVVSGRAVSAESV
jgi:hypothetical protein